MNSNPPNHSLKFLYILVFVICLVAFVLTAAPTILITDSPEFVAAAKTLGIPHAPGYPLYMMTAHIFTWLPFDDPAYALNLYSALCMALVAPLLMYIMQTFVEDHLVSASVTLAVMFSYYMWTMGIVAEVYAPQLLMLTATGASLCYLYRQVNPRWWQSLMVGILFGLSVAMSPSSIFLMPGLLLAFLWLKIPWAHRMGAGIGSLLIFGLCLLYFPLAYQADPSINAAGVYNSEGEFEAVDLTTLDGIWWILSGAQFDSEFFADGILLTPSRLAETGRWLFTNLFAFGFFMALVGGYVLFQKHRGVLMVWLALFLPYTYFFMTYGADDRDTMFGPSHLLLGILFGIGVRWASEDFSLKIQMRGLAILPALFFVVNFNTVNARDATGLREHVEIVVAELPPYAYVFGDWADSMPLRYYQTVFDVRPDVEIYTLFFFEYDKTRVQAYVDALLEDGQAVIFLDDSAEKMLDFTHYNFREFYTLPNGPHNRRPIRIVKVEHVN